MTITEPLMRRLWAKVDSSGGLDACWPFTGSRNKKGYGRIGLGSRDQGVALAHRVVAIAALGIPHPERPHTRHLCGTSACCNPLHLAWGNYVENESDRRRHGTCNRGSRHGAAKLDASKVAEIRRRVSSGETQVSVASDFGVVQQTVGDIVTGRTWGWLAASREEVMPS